MLAALFAALPCLQWPASLAKARLNLYVLHAGVQCVMHSSLMPGSTIAQAPLGVSMHTSLLDACSMMKAGVGTIHRKQRNDSLLLQHLRRPLSLSPQVNREQEVGVPVHSGRLTVFTEALHVVIAETFSPGH